MTRANLAAENLALRQQFSVYRHRRPRPRLRRRDRIFGVWLSRCWTGWQHALVIVQPDTVIGWHRQGFRLYWRWRSRGRAGRPKVEAEVRQLIGRRKKPGSRHTIDGLLLGSRSTPCGVPHPVKPPLNRNLTCIAHPGAGTCRPSNCFLRGASVRHSDAASKVDSGGRQMWSRRAVTMTPRRFATCFGDRDRSEKMQFRRTLRSPPRMALRFC